MKNIYKVKMEITPSELLCGAYGPGCPALFELEDGSIIVVGKKVEIGQLQADAPEIHIGDNEIAVQIPRRLIGR